MELTLFVILFVALASSSPLSDHRHSRCEDGVVSYINITTSPFDRIMRLHVVTPDVHSTPATVLVGTSDKVLRCLQEDPNVCEVYFSANSAVTSLLVTGEYYYAGLGPGDIYKCNLHRKESCEMFLRTKVQVDSLVSADGHLLAGIYNGTVFRCRLHESSTCRHFQLHEGSSYVFALMQFREYIYAGVGINLLRCSLSGERCTIINSTSPGFISGFTSIGDNVYAVSFGGNTMWKCSVTSDTTSCETRPLGYEYPRDIALYNGVLYTLENEKGIYTCKWANSIDCTSYGNFTRAYSMVFVYGTFKMQSRYADEDTNCNWQGDAMCPPTVIYYNAQQRRQFEVQVKDGQLYDAFGKLIDTSNADEGRSGPAAIFAMSPEGKIMLSKRHISGHLHVSSLVAGNPVSGAGEMVVKNGVIQKINTCSDHYRPDLDLNPQVIESLRAQGYTDHIDSQLCDDEDNGFQSSYLNSDQ